MTEATYAALLDLAAAGLLLSAVLVVWRREMSALVRILIAQGTALAAVPILAGLHGGDGVLVAVGAAVLVLRALVLPHLLRRVLRAAGDDDARETAPVLNTTTSLLAVALLTVLAYGVSRPVVALAPSPATRAAPLAFAVVLVAVFSLVTRRRALSQVVGFLQLDNGIAALAFLLTLGVPLVVELGASLDVLLAVLVLQVLTGRMRVKFGGTDLDQLRELHD